MSRTSTRDPDSPFNDDLVDIQILHHLRNHAPQSGNTEFVHPDILAVNVKATQDETPFLQHDLRHRHDRSKRGRYSRGGNRSLALICDDIDRHWSASHLSTQVA